MEIQLDRQLFFPTERKTLFSAWKAVFFALLAFIRPMRVRTHITAGRMSDQWLQQYLADRPKHHLDDYGASA